MNTKELRVPAAAKALWKRAMVVAVSDGNKGWTWVKVCMLGPFPDMDLGKLRPFGVDRGNICIE